MADSEAERFVYTTQLTDSGDMQPPFLNTSPQTKRSILPVWGCFVYELNVNVHVDIIMRMKNREIKKNNKNCTSEAEPKEHSYNYNI